MTDASDPTRIEYEELLTGEVEHDSEYVTSVDRHQSFENTGVKVVTFSDGQVETVLPGQQFEIKEGEEGLVITKLGDEAGHELPPGVTERGGGWYRVQVGDEIENVQGYDEAIDALATLTAAVADKASQGDDIGDTPADDGSNDSSPTVEEEGEAEGDGSADPESTT